MATPIDAGAVLAALRAVGATHVVTVPDTNQRTVLDLLDDAEVPSVVRATTEDDVFGICAGLWMTGMRPIALIQQLGLFASANALRGMVHDHCVPLAVLAGLYGRELDCAPAASDASAVRLCEPLLDALEVRWTLVDGADAVGLIEVELATAFEERCTSVVLLGAPTA